MESTITKANEGSWKYLTPTPLVDTDNQQIIAYVHPLPRHSSSPVVMAISNYCAVRDDIRYDPYTARLDLAHLKASFTSQAQKA